MADGMYRIGIVGAASLKGKELGEELEDSLLAASDFVLFDDEEATGQVTAVADEPAFIQQVEAGSFARMDFVSSPAMRTRRSNTGRRHARPGRASWT
jgi:aspartate-semialdehyde dehydrogenase